MAISVCTLQFEAATAHCIVLACCSQTFIFCFLDNSAFRAFRYLSRLLHAQRVSFGALGASLANIEIALLAAGVVNV